MKKIITIFSAILLVMAFSVSVFAEEEPTNYLTEPKWNMGYAQNIKIEDGVVIASGISNSWCTPQLPLLDALKAALGDEDYTDITLSFDARATFTEDAEITGTSANALFRATDGKPDITDFDEWNTSYEEFLDGEEVLFMNRTGNIMYYCGSLTLTEDWETCEIDLYIAKPHLENDFVLEWSFCLDGISEYESIETIEFRNFAVYLTDDLPAKVTPTPSPTPEGADSTATPTVTKGPLMTPDLGQAPVATTAPADDAGSGAADDTTTTNPTGIIIGVVAGVVVVAAVVAVVVVSIKKKKNR